MKYKFKYKHKNWFFWKTEEVVGHGIDFVEEIEFDNNNKFIKKTKKPLDAMIIYYSDGSIKRICNWSNYDMKLGTDWKLALKEKMENEINQNIKLSK